MSYGFLEETVKNRNLSIFISLAVVVGVIGVATVNTSAKDCVNVYVDYGVLDSNSKSTECVPVSEGANGLEVLTKSGLLIEGTGKYGLQVVCRVNSLPSATRPIGIEGNEDYVETCAEMPAAFAYWAVLVKKGALPWGWADTGIDKVTLNPGDSVGLVFAENDNVRFPE
jgi:hypothetical protein